jgi:hypothetical protein
VPLLSFVLAGYQLAKIFTHLGQGQGFHRLTFCMGCSGQWLYFKPLAHSKLLIKARISSCPLYGDQLLVGMQSQGT